MFEGLMETLTGKPRQNKEVATPVEPQAQAQEPVDNQNHLNALKAWQDKDPHPADQRLINELEEKVNPPSPETPPPGLEATPSPVQQPEPVQSPINLPEEKAA